ncbi:hypothetical protein Q8A73_009472 [Channa argus]|nr:hypothetical protein Q8A73_009472 [Channa argus]
MSKDQIPHGFPTIDMGPQLKVVEKTRTATMLCAASGNPDPEIYWFKDFLPVDISSSNGRIKQLRSGGTPIRGALQIENSEESDQGKYECVAVNSAGTRYSAPANLYVRGHPLQQQRFSLVTNPERMLYLLTVNEQTGSLDSAAMKDKPVDTCLVSALTLLGLADWSRAAPASRWAPQARPGLSLRTPTPYCKPFAPLTAPPPHPAAPYIALRHILYH